MTTIKIVAEKAKETSVLISELPMGVRFKFDPVQKSVCIKMETDESSPVWYADKHSIYRVDGNNSVNTTYSNTKVYPCNPDGTLIEDDPAAVEKVRADSIGIGRMFSREKDNEDFIYLVAAMASDYVHSLLFADGCNAACTALTPSADLVTPVIITKIHYRKGAE